MFQNTSNHNPKQNIESVDHCKEPQIVQSLFHHTPNCIYANTIIYKKDAKSNVNVKFGPEDQYSKLYDSVTNKVVKGHPKISMSICCDLFVFISLCNPQIHKEVEQAKNCQKPVEVIKMTLVQIVCDPTNSSMACGDFCHN